MSLTGILLDVSASMKSNVGSGIDEDGGPWVRSIFKVIDDLIEHDVSPDDRVFAVGFGARSGNEIFDVIGTIQQFETNKNISVTKIHIIEKILYILEQNGARNIRNWATIDLISQEVASDMASSILRKLESDDQFLRKFVDEFLPSACRDVIKVPEAALPILHGLGTALGFGSLRYELKKVEDFVSARVCLCKPATEEEIREVIHKAKCYLKADSYQCYLKEVGSHSIFSVQDASRIIHGCIDEEELSDERSRGLLKEVEPFIYGGTPLYQSLEKATELFQNDTSKNKLLFLLSNGQPSDGSINDTAKINRVVSKLDRAGVQVVSCFITKSSDIQPKRLYDEMPPNWEPGAKFLFSLSSKLPTQLLPHAILAKRGWVTDIANNETKLFMQVNHPDNLREVCNMARDVVCSPDALSELLVSVDLDMYINQSTGSFEAKKQVGGTCYANASAAVLHLATRRILGREGGYPEFDTLKDEMIESYGIHGASTSCVLQEICPKYRLHSRKVCLKEAMEAIVKKRPVVAIFSLTKDEWAKFSNFYENNPTGVLTENQVNIRNRSAHVSTAGHAVVLTSYNSRCLTLMNSWGDKWGDKGFFRVQNAEVLNLEFIDVYWTLDDLTNGEKTFYREHGADVAGELMKSLKGLQKAVYTCPKCSKTSPITEFTGTLSRVNCPRCLRQFSTNDNEGNVLALNIYLTSVAKLERA